MRTTKVFALLGAVVLLSWAVVGMTMPEAEATTLPFPLVYEKPIPQDENIDNFVGDGKSSTSYYQPIELGMFSWLLFW